MTAIRGRDVLGGGIVLLLLLILVPGIWCRSVGAAKRNRCAYHLASLWKLQENYRVQFAHPVRYPTETGERFWLKLRTPPTVLIGPEQADLFHCPVKEDRTAGCDYRGPASNVNDSAVYGAQDPVGADVDGNHGTDDHHVLLKCGGVVAVRRSDPEWIRAAEKTSGRSAAGAGDRGLVLRWMFPVVVGLLLWRRFRRKGEDSFRALGQEH